MVSPKFNPTIKGEINFRGHPISLIDLSEFLGLPATEYKNAISYVLVCEYSKTIQGFLVTQPNVLITKGWDEIIKPKGALYENSCLTAITYHHGEPIQILDVEKILAEIVGIDRTIAQDLLERAKKIVTPQHNILAVDDSKAACQLIEQTLATLGIRHTVVDNAPYALEILQQSLDKGADKQFSIILTDIEMPLMDGFTFTRKVKENPRLRHHYLAIHSSLSNKANQHKARQMGADDFIPKFTADNIVQVVLDQLEKSSQK